MVLDMEQLRGSSRWSYLQRPANAEAMRLSFLARPQILALDFIDFTVSGGTEGIRTLDLFLARETLSQLSYSPKKTKSGSIRPTLRTAIRCCSNLYFRGESNLSNAWLPSSKQGSVAGDNLHKFFNVMLIVLIALSPYFIYIQLYFCIHIIQLINNLLF